MSAWEDIGVQAVLEIGAAKAAAVAARTADSDNDELYALKLYIDELEHGLEVLGIKIHDNGAVSPTDEGTRA